MYVQLYGRTNVYKSLDVVDNRTLVSNHLCMYNFTIDNSIVSTNLKHKPFYVQLFKHTNVYKSFDLDVVDKHAIEFYQRCLKQKPFYV